MKRLFNSRLLFTAILLFGATSLIAQDVTISQLTGGVAGSPLTGGATNQAILGIQFDKDGGGTNAVTGVTITLTENPTGRFQNVRLCRSDNNNSFDAADLANSVSTGTFSTSPNSIIFTGTITPFSVSGNPSSSPQTR